MTPGASIPEASYIEYARLLATHPQAGYHQLPTSQWLMGEIRHTFYNRVMQVQFDSGGVDDRIDEMVNRFISRRLPMAWMVGPSSQPVDLSRRLEAHGMLRMDTLLGMAADLSRVPEEGRLPVRLTIQKVSGLESLHLWVTIVAHSYNLPRDIAHSIFELYSVEPFSPHQPFRHFIGSVDCQPVAAALLLLGIHSAGIYNVSTLPEARRQGFGRAMTHFAMQEARTLGYPIASLASTAMGVGIYTDLGFTACCQLETYKIERPTGK